MSITSAVTPLPSAAAPLPGGYGIQSAAIGANAVPNLRQTANGLLPAESTTAMHRQLPHQPSDDSQPASCPSAVSAEQALQSRALLTLNLSKTCWLRGSCAHQTCMLKRRVSGIRSTYSP